MSVVWIVWEYDGDCPYIGSVHDTEAGARAEAQRLLDVDRAKAYAAHEVRERARIANAGAWRWTFPEQLAPEWVPTNPPPEAAPFTFDAARFERRVEMYELAHPHEPGSVSAETLDPRHREVSAE